MKRITMKATLMNITCTAQRSLLVAAALFLHRGAMALPASPVPELGSVTLNAANNSGDAVSVKAKMAALSGYSTAPTPSLGETSARPLFVTPVYAGGFGSAGYTQFAGGYGGSPSTISTGTPPPTAGGSLTPAASGNSLAGFPPPAASTAMNPGGSNATPGSLPTSPTGSEVNHTELPVLTGPPPSVPAGVTPANQPLDLSTGGTGLAGTMQPLTVSPPSVGEPVIAGVQVPAGTYFQGESPLATPTPVVAAVLFIEVTPVPDSGGMLSLFSLGLAILFAVRRSTSPRT